MEHQKPPFGLDLLGRFHPLLVHFPIAWLMLLLLVDLVALLHKQELWNRSGLVLLVLTVLSFVPAIATGLIRHATHGAQGEDQALVHLHRNLMLAMATVTTAALGLRLWRKNRLEGAYRVIYLLLILTAAALITLGGHMGGKLVFGENYLPF